MIVEDYYLRQKNRGSSDKLLFVLTTLHIPFTISNPAPQNSSFS